MRLSGETNFFLGVIIATLIILTGAIIFLAKPPKEISTELLVPQDAWATGSATPKATLVEFSDFECPACGSAYPTVKQVTEKYKDQLKFVYRHFPLDQHTQAREAANAAEAAGTQGKFWEMHDKLFENQTSLSKETYKKLAKDLNLDFEKFDKALTEDAYKDKVQRDVNDGIAISISATPTFFLNGKKLNLFAFSDLEGAVKKALQ